MVVFLTTIYCPLNNTKDLNGDKKITCPHCEHKENVIDIKNE